MEVEVRLDRMLAFRSRILSGARPCGSCNAERKAARHQSRGCMAKERAGAGGGGDREEAIGIEGSSSTVSYLPSAFRPLHRLRSWRGHLSDSSPTPPHNAPGSPFQPPRAPRQRAEAPLRIERGALRGLFASKRGKESNRPSPKLAAAAAGGGRGKKKAEGAKRESKPKQKDRCEVAGNPPPSRAKNPALTVTKEAAPQTSPIARKRARSRARKQGKARTRDIQGRSAAAATATVRRRKNKKEHLSLSAPPMGTEAKTTHLLARA